MKKVSVSIQIADHKGTNTYNKIFKTRVCKLHTYKLKRRIETDENEKIIVVSHTFQIQRIIKGMTENDQ